MIPSRHGLHQTVGDPLGAGGIFLALRTMPVMQSLVVEELLEAHSASLPASLR